jgi:hypothetical protein
MIVSMGAQQVVIQAALCRKAFAYFVHTYCEIYDAVSGDWLPFHLWPRQIEVAQTLEADRLVVILKARQLGMTWLCLAYALWLMIFRPAATILIFCRTDREAVYLLGPERLRGMWERLPDWLKAGIIVTTDSDHTWGLSNGSIARALPVSAGDAFTVTYCLVDEADICPDLNDLMRRAKPTIDAGGRMTLLSRSDKSQPQSIFKAIYRGAVRDPDNSEWTPVFLPWTARPSRTQAWYEAQKRDVLARTGALDDLHEQYPLIDLDALAPSALDKRLAADWLRQCTAEQLPLRNVPSAPAVPGLRIFAPPKPDGRYVIGVDPAEGNPGSDASAFQVLDCTTGEQAAVFGERVEPSVLASYVDMTGTFYMRAAVMLETNSIGTAVLLWLREHSKLYLLPGHDGKTGWRTTTLSKTLMYNTLADQLRNGEVKLHDFESLTELAMIEGATLSAPTGEHDDLAMSFALACAGRGQAGWSFDAIGGTGKRTSNRWAMPA